MTKKRNWIQRLVLYILAVLLLVYPVETIAAAPDATTVPVATAVPQAVPAAPSSVYTADAVTAMTAGELRAAQDELTAIVSSVEPSVVSILGKVSRLSKDYYEAAENIVMGSGIIYKHNGYIITNCHVVAECDTLLVIMSDKKVYEAKVVGMDEGTDLALIKIEKGMLKPVVFADSSKVQVGASVITIGTPLDFSLHNSVGLGIVSGINRENLGFTEYQFIQTDAVANPGNSGGPLVDIDGKVLGIVEGGLMSYSGISFCIPSQTIEYVIPKLMRYGRVPRPDVGAVLVQGLAADYGLPNSQGLFFTEIADGGPSDKAGITEADVLISIDGAAVNTYSKYTEILMKYLPGDTALFALTRDGTIRFVSLTFTEQCYVHCKE